MTRLRLKCEVVVEYDANPEHYPGCDSPEAMLALDIGMAEENPMDMLGMLEAKWTITGEVLP